MGQGSPRPVKKVKKELRTLSSRPQFSLSSFAPSSLSTSGTSSKLKPNPTSTSSKGKQRPVQVVDLTIDDEDDDDDQDVKAAAIAASSTGSEMWVDWYTPTTREELGVHPKKVQDVANWIGEAYNSKLAKYRRLLVMSGPTGAAKTATLRVLAKELDIDILEYRNSGNLEFANDDSRISLVDHFTSFLSRAGMAPALDLVPDPEYHRQESAHSRAETTAFATTHSKRLILLEDLPNTSHHPTKLALRSALQQYLASPRVTCPLVLIVSEALARPGTGAETDSTSRDASFRRDESVDARSVCGVDVLHAPGCREIPFNPIAATIMKKALGRILDRVYSSSGLLPAQHRPAPGTIDIVISHSNGDIRSALMSLQFLAGNPDLTTSKITGLASGRAAIAPTSKKRKKGTDDVIGDKDRVKKLLQFITARESSLFVFHALGKVLYSKRWGESAEDDRKDAERVGILQARPTDKLPRHLCQAWSRAPSKVDPDVLFAEAPVESDIFLSYLHHNYTQFTNEIEECSGILDGMSAADSLMRLEGEDWSQRVPLTSQYSFNTAVRSTMLSLPEPVPRRKQVLRKSELWDKLRLQRANEDVIEELYRKRDGIALVPPCVLEPGSQGVTLKFDARPGTSTAEEKRETGQDHEWQGGGGAQRSRRCLATELIPYVGLIRRHRRGGGGGGGSSNSTSRVASSASPGTNAFFVEMATFPPVANSRDIGAGSLKGEALGEKDPGQSEDEAEDASDERQEQGYDQEADSMDVDNGDRGGVDLNLEEEDVGVGELLIDPDDDIEED